MPSPFMRSMGVGGFLIPLVSILGAVTLQPALLSLYGRRGTRRVRVWRLGDAGRHRGFWERRAGSIMRRPLAFLVVGATVLLLAALPTVALRLTPGSAKGIPQHPQAVHGLDVLKNPVGAGALPPTQIIIDPRHAGGTAAPRVQRSIGRLVADIGRDPEVVYVRYRPTRPFLDPSGRYAQIVRAG